MKSNIDKYIKDNKTKLDEFFLWDANEIPKRYDKN